LPSLQPKLSQLQFSSNAPGRQHGKSSLNFFEFFTVPIRNANTRAAYYRAIQQFLAWVERAGYQDLEDIEPITVAAYIETLQRQAAPPTVKQHMAAIRMLFSWLTEKGVLAMNPAREVKTERFSRTEGKTLAFVDGEVLLRWPNPIHRGNGRCVIFIDERADKAQRAALSEIVSGKAGPGGPFEIFVSTYSEPPTEAMPTLLHITAN